MSEQTAAADREVDRQTRALEAWASGDRADRAFYGQQYGEPDHDAILRVVRDEWLLPELQIGRTVMEIGAGGGRWSRYFPGRGVNAILVDGTPASEVAIRSAFDYDGFRFVVSPDGRLPTVADSSVDYVWSYDTFVHFHDELFDAYLVTVGRVLKPGGKFHLHFARLWSGQQMVNSVCFQYQCHGAVIGLLKAAGMQATGRELPVRSGFGSVLVEAVKAD